MNDDFSNLWLSHFPYKTREDLYENLYLRAIVDSYNYIDKSIEDENKIRDRFFWDLTERNPLTKQYVDLYLLKISFEDWKMVSEEEKRRVDLTFFISCFGSFEVECKIFVGNQTEKGKYLTDGLIRFVELKYSKVDSAAGMVGFVVKGDINSIFRANVKNAKKFYPSNSNELIKTPINSHWQYGFVSLHERIDKNDIEIYHLLFEFNG